MAFVADNSVVLAWFVGSQATPYTSKLRNRAREEPVHAPAVWPLEFVHALWSLQKRGALDATAVSTIVDLAERLGVMVDYRPADLKATLSLSRQFNLSAYDASYLELALRLNLPLAVRDSPLRDAARRAGIALA
jgi:predicted nucleic acid-binding protein